MDAGVVTIKLDDKSSSANFTVEEIAATFTVPLKDISTFEKSTVEFVCELNKDVPKIQWFLDDMELQPDDGIEFVQDGRQHRLVMHDVLMDDNGKITAKCGDAETSAILTVKEIPVDFTVPLSDVSALEKSTAEFVCELSKEVDKVKWFVDDVEVKESDKYKVVSKGKVHKLQIVNVMVEDEGQVSILVNDKKTTASLFVQGK